MPALPRPPARAVRTRAGFAPRIAFETDNFVAVEGLVAQGLGVATAAAHWRWRPRRGMPGVVTRPTAAAEARSLHLVTARGAERVPAVARDARRARAGRRRLSRRSRAARRTRRRSTSMDGDV